MTRGDRAALVILTLCVLALWPADRLLGLVVLAIAAAMWRALPSRSQCDDVATVEAATEHGAPLRFCRLHWRRQDDIRANYGPVLIIAGTPG